MKSETDKLISKHGQLNQSDNMKVVSHVQREEDDWIRHTVMLEGIDVPFIYRRKKQYQSLKGARITCLKLIKRYCNKLSNYHMAKSVIKYA